MSEFRRFVPLALFLALGVFLAIGLTLNPKDRASPLIGKPAPEFILPQLANPQASINSAEFQGKVTIVNFWASWCLECRREHSVLVDLANSGHGRLYGLNYKDEPDAAIQWLNNFGDPYIASAADYEGKTGIEFGLYGVPETYIIDKQGSIRYKRTGAVSAEMLQADILPLIKELEEEGS